MLPKYRIETPPWKENVALEHLMSTLINLDITVKIVGGAVRDAITGTFSKKTDVDLAVDVPPEEVQQKLKNFTIIPTGISHGTLTVLVQTQPFEVTSLRKDVFTDGRHAIVEYTKNFLEDAQRRDFTINALYADFDGKVYDPLDQGLEDLENFKIKFVGNSEERIKEDFLRIVRFFRFMGYLESAKVDEADLKFARELSPHLMKISKERLWGELQKIASSRFPIKALEALDKHDVMQYLCPGEWDIASLHKINDWLLHVPDKIFALLSLGYKSSFLNFPLPIPSKLRDRLSKRVNVDLVFSESILYRMGKTAYKDQFIDAYIQNTPFTSFTLRQFNDYLQKIDNWQLPTLPISGHTLIKKGVLPGPKMGEMLKYLENWWIDQDFNPNEDECLRELEKSYGTKFY